MDRSHLIRLYPNKKQLEMLAKTAGVTRYCYNWGVAKWKEMYDHGEHCDQYVLSRLWTKERPEWTKEVSRQPQTKALLNLGGAYTAFFKKKTKKPPTFWKKGHRDTFYINNVQAFFRDDTHVHLSAIGDVKLAEKLRFTGKILGYNVSRRADRWYVSVSVELERPGVKNPDLPPVGVDVGVKHWAVTSDGCVLNQPAMIRKLDKQLRHAKRVMSRRVKTSKRRDKARVKVAKIYARMRNVKLDAVHKFSHMIAKSHGVVCCEDLNIAAMGKGLRSLRKAVKYSCMSELRRQLRYKSAEYVEIAMTFPSSKRCSNCGTVKDKLSLKERVYSCHNCGMILDRDLNAAINIRNEGLRVYTEGHSGSACGGCGSV